MSESTQRRPGPVNAWFAANTMSSQPAIAGTVSTAKPMDENVRCSASHWARAVPASTAAAACMCGFLTSMTS